LNILHVIPTLDPVAGGPPLIAARLASAQAMLGHQVQVMTYRSREAGQRRIAAENQRLAGFDRLTLHLLPYITWRERLFGWHALRSAQKIVPQMDIVHLHGVWEPQLLHAASIARKCGKPYLILLNGMLLPWAMRRGVLKKRFALAIGFRKMLAGGLLQFGSRDEEQAAHDLGFTQPGVIIPNGVSPEELDNPPPLGIFRAAHPELGDEPFVLFLGRLHEQKGIDLLLSAFEIVLAKRPSARLVIAGPDYGLSANLQQRIAAMNQQNHLLLIGPIYGSQKRSALRDAAYFCLPSRHEGFSLAVLEAMAMGTPVVISPECHFPEVAEAGAGLIPSLDPPAIADALLQMLADAPLRNRASVAAKQLVADHYTWPYIARQTIETYEQLRQERGIQLRMNADARQ
jgi:glycosyltransferase involved in cell wall biosynthesis